MKALNTYLTFDGNAREAMNFYQKSIGGELCVFTFGESPMPCAEADKDKVMHASLTNGAHVLMASDAPPGMPLTAGNNYTLNIACDSAEEAAKYFNALSQNGKVTMPLQETFWAASFGMLTDKFGINWMFNFEKPFQQ